MPGQREGCGSPAGRQAHRRNHEPVCDDCRAAYNNYMLQYRRAQARARLTDEQLQAQATANATQRLVAEHVSRYTELLTEELAKVT